MWRHDAKGELIMQYGAGVACLEGVILDGGRRRRRRGDFCGGLVALALVAPSHARKLLRHGGGVKCEARPGGDDECPSSYLYHQSEEALAYQKKSSVIPVMPALRRMRAHYVPRMYVADIHSSPPKPTHGEGISGHFVVVSGRARRGALAAAARRRIGAISPVVVSTGVHERATGALASRSACYRCAAGRKCAMKARKRSGVVGEAEICRANRRRVRR